MRLKLVENFWNRPFFFFPEKLTKASSTANLREQLWLQLQVQGWEREPDGLLKASLPCSWRPALLSCSHSLRKEGLSQKETLV